MEAHTATSGLLEVATTGHIGTVEGALVIDFTADTGVALELNGVPFAAGSTADLAAALRASRVVDAERQPISIPFEVGLEGLRLIISEGDTLGEVPGAHLTGAAAQLAVEKASRIAASDAAWPAALEASDESLDLDGLAGSQRWDGPLVVSMPRTGSTLMGTLFLFCRDSSNPSGYRLDRYIHEPLAPVFWRGDDFESVGRFLSAPLSERDIVQESAYQFADPRIARWFLTQARSPVVFTMRHPQLAWPSRWRAMLAQLIDANPSDPRTGDYRHALEADDFSALGTLLTESVRPADNGFYAFMALLDLCVREGIEFVLVDNTRFREAPEATMRTLCERMDIMYTPEIVEWTDLQPVLPRVVMSDLARGEEYRWYYEGTLGSSQGIRPERSTRVERDRFPEILRGAGDDDLLTIDEAVTWYQLLLARPDTLP